jgi:hypothetical protein
MLVFEAFWLGLAENIVEFERLESLHISCREHKL